MYAFNFYYDVHFVTHFAIEMLSQVILAKDLKKPVFMVCFSISPA